MFIIIIIKWCTILIFLFSSIIRRNERRTSCTLYSPNGHGALRTCAEGDELRGRLAETFGWGKMQSSCPIRWNSNQQPMMMEFRVLFLIWVSKFLLGNAINNLRGGKLYNWSIFTLPRQLVLNIHHQKFIFVCQSKDLWRPFDPHSEPLLF